MTFSFWHRPRNTHKTTPVLEFTVPESGTQRVIAAVSEGHYLGRHLLWRVGETHTSHGKSLHLGTALILTENRPRNENYNNVYPCRKSNSVRFSTLLYKQIKWLGYSCPQHVSHPGQNAPKKGLGLYLIPHEVNFPTSRFASVLLRVKPQSVTLVAYLLLSMWCSHEQQSQLEL